MRRDPQEKKALSYARDRRNHYGENDKSSRRNIAKNKRLPVRAERHREHQVLTAATGAVAADAAEAAEMRLAVRRRSRRWRKVPDTPLADSLVYRLRNRARRGMIDPDDVEARIDRIRARRRRAG